MLIGQPPASHRMVPVLITLSDPDFKVHIYEHRKHYSAMHLIVQLQIIYLLNFQFNVLLMCHPSAIAEPLVRHKWLLPLQMLLTSCLFTLDGHAPLLSIWLVDEWSINGHKDIFLSLL